MATTNPGFRFDNSYARLPPPFFTRIKPTPVSAPKLVILNEALAGELGLNVKSLLEAPALFAGNEIPEGAEPIAQAYAGHQFGHFNMLGDGRANLLGEHIAPNGARFDIQLKGSGPTPYSRRGDGRAALGPMLREYIVSEAMHALRIPTTRSLAVVTTGEPVFRETALTGAILTRVAKSHIRVGTFEYSAALENPEMIRALADHTIARHYPELAQEPEPYLSLLRAVIEAQARLIASWMHIGFIHGVMNTDNMALSGETIDYGPCAFMDAFSFTTLFSSIDRNGRYAYGNQPRIAQWNLARLAEALLPLFHEEEGQAVEKAKAAIESFPAVYERHWIAGMGAKLGLAKLGLGEAKLVTDLLALMEQSSVDYTNTFRALQRPDLPAEPLFQTSAFKEWHTRWKAKEPSLALMAATNPAVIPRNHKVEEALAAAEQGDLAVTRNLLNALAKPYEESEGNRAYREAPASSDGYQTFCGT